MEEYVRQLLEYNPNYDAQLLEKAWGIDYAGETRTVDVHIGTLRTKLGSAGRMIVTVRGVGYKLEVPDDK